MAEPESLDDDTLFDEDDDNLCHVSFAKFAEYAPIPENLKAFQKLRSPVPANPVLGFALTLPALGTPVRNFVGGWLGATMCLGGACTTDDDSTDERQAASGFRLDALRIACLCGKPDIVEALLYHRVHPTVREAEACELLGAVRVFCTDTMDWFCNEPWTSVACWKKALDLRSSSPLPSDAVDTHWRSSVPALRDCKPASTHADLDHDIGQSRQKLFEQAFVVLERTLGLPWRIEEPIELRKVSCRFISRRLIAQMVRGICRQASSTANVLQLLGCLLAYVLDRMAVTTLLTTLDAQLQPSQAGVNVLTQFRECRDVSVRDVADFLRSIFSRFPTQAGFLSVKSISFVLGKIDFAMVNDAMGHDEISAGDLGILLHGVLITLSAARRADKTVLETFAKDLVRLGASVHEPCWFRTKCSIELARGTLLECMAVH